MQPSASDQLGIIGLPAPVAELAATSWDVIVVGVSLDTVQQIESHLITRNYEGFTGPKGPRIRGRAAPAVSRGR